jgi:hypothetical protein
MLREGTQMKAAVFVALLGAMVAGNVNAQTIFADDFASGDARAWDSNLGNASYPSGAVCPAGAAHCGAMTLAGGVAQQSPYWSKDFNYSGQVIYVSMDRMFPAGYSWNGEASENARSNWTHKLIILDTADNIGRFHLNLSVAIPPTQVDFLSPFFRPEFESVSAPLINQWTDVRYPADGKYHRVAFEVTRKPGAGNGRLRLWIDEALVFDKAGSTCGTTCSPVIRAKIGAYVNQGADVQKTFYLGSVLIAGGTREEVLAAQQQPDPTQLTPLQHIETLIVAQEDQEAALQDQLSLVETSLVSLRYLRSLLMGAH